MVGESVNGTDDNWRMCFGGVDYPRLTWEYAGIGDFGCLEGLTMEVAMVFFGNWLSKI